MFIEKELIDYLCDLHQTHANALKFPVDLLSSFSKTFNCNICDKPISYSNYPSIVSVVLPKVALIVRDPFCYMSDTLLRP